MKFTTLGLRLFLMLGVLIISSSSCKNLFSKDTVPDSGCIECLKEFSLSEEQAKNIRESIDADEKEQKLNTLYTHRAKALGFNGNVLIIQKGVVVYQQSFGYENYVKKTKLTEHSKFQLASLSKTFTAVAILKLMEQGSLTLEDSIQRFYPGFPIHGITVQMLLSHRSGLPDYRFSYPELARKGFKGITNKDLMARFEEKPPIMKARPDRVFCYCNTNYAILASIIEHITEMPYDEYMRQYVFEPLGMKDTYVITSASDSLNVNKTIGYNYKWQLEPHDAFDGIVGDKGIYSTTGDLAKWYHTLNSECFLKRETLKMAYEPRSFEKAGDKNYGLGFRMNYCNNDYKCIYHNGWWHGYNSSFYMCPKTESVIIVLGNRFNRSVYMAAEPMNILMAGSGAEVSEELSE